MPFWSRKPPAYADTHIRQDQHATRASVLTLTGHLPVTLDATFTPVSYDWLFDSRTQRQLRTHFWSLPSYTSQAWDCENFATELVQWICRQAALAGVPASPQAFVICVDNVVPFARIRDGRHALNLILTDREPIVIEPQSIRNGIAHLPLSDYPNAGTIFKVYQ